MLTNTNRIANVYGGKTEDAGHHSRDETTYTVASRFGNGATPDDREIVVKADGSLGWSETENSGRTYHFAGCADAERVMALIGPHREGAIVHVMAWGTWPGR